MYLDKCRGLVLKTSDLGENDKLVVIYTDKLGKISAVAKGAKKGKSKYLPLTLQFCFADYVLFKGKNLYTLSEGVIIESFQSLLEDLEPLTYGSYFCELVDIASIAEESNDELFKLLVSSLYIMKSKAVDYEVLARAFELKFLNLTGYGIDFEHCSSCSKRISSSNYISFQNYGGVCNGCEKTNGIYISPGTFSAIRFLNNLPLDKTYRVNLPEEVRAEVNKVLSMLIGINYSRKPKSLNMLEFF